MLWFFFANFLSIICKFNLTNGLYIAPGPQKGILYGGSLENRWPSNGGHELSLNKPQHDVPFWASHSMYIVMVHFIVGICDLSWPLMASKTEQYHILVIFLHIAYCKFNLTNGLYIDPGPQKGILYWGFISGKCNGGHNISSNKPLLDVPF